MNGLDKLDKLDTFNEIISYNEGYRFGDVKLNGWDISNHLIMIGYIKKVDSDEDEENRYERTVKKPTIEYEPKDHGKFDGKVTDMYYNLNKNLIKYGTSYLDAIDIVNDNFHNINQNLTSTITH